MASIDPSCVNDSEAILVGYLKQQTLMNMNHVSKILVPQINGNNVKHFSVSTQVKDD